MSASPSLSTAPVLSGPTVKKTLATHLDLAPTILHILGITPPAPPHWYGSNLFATFPERQIALLPHYKKLVLENDVVKKIPSLNSRFLKFYQYRRKILEGH